MSTEYRYRNEYPSGPCTITIRGERVPQGESSAWGERLLEDTREIRRGWIVEERRETPSTTSSKHVKASPKKRKPATKG